jgi:putative FmdB family regulatory protein
MPTYDYQCTTCNKQFEHVQRMSEDALTACLCEQKGSVHRIITTSNFALKGGGWYVTDFRGGSKPSGESATATPAAATPPAPAASATVPAPTTPSV